MLQKYRILVDDLFTRHRKPAPCDFALQEAVAWIYRAQDATPGRGVSRSYLLGKLWTPSYPETTGYIIPTFLNCRDISGDLEAKKRDLEMAAIIHAIRGLSVFRNAGSRVLRSDIPKRLKTSTWEHQ